MTLTFGSLFAGIGGFEAGFEASGLRCSWQVEKDDDCLRVLAHHWPDALRLTDVCEAGKRNLPPVDVICGGFPCQDLSVAGKRAGLMGARSGLFYEMTRIVNELRPALLVWENVPGLLSSRHGRDFLAVLVELERIGYSGCWSTLDARWFGVAQRRRRVFGVFARRDVGTRCAVEILALARRSKGHPETGGEAKADVAGSLGAGAKGSGWRDDLDRAGAVVAAFGGNNTSGPIDVATAVNACKTASGRQDFESETFVTHTLRAEGCDASEDGTGRGTPLVPFIVNAAESCAKESHARESDTARCLDQTGGFASSQGGTVVGFNIVGLGQQGKNHAYEAAVTGAIQHKGNSASGNEAGTVIGFHPTQDPISGDVCPALGQGNKQGCATAAVAFKESQSGTREGRVHATLDANKGSRRQEGVRQGMMVRRLTPLECCRLQGFPDDWLDLTPPLSDSAKYRILGNAVCVPVARWLGKQILEALP